MSIWAKLEDDDIDIDWDLREVNFCIGGDDMGNEYRTITFQQLEALWEEYQTQNPSEDHP